MHASAAPPVCRRRCEGQLVGSETTSTSTQIDAGNATSLRSMANAMSSDGVRSPDNHRLTFAGDAPTADASSSCVHPRTRSRDRNCSGAQALGSPMSQLFPIGNRLSTGNRMRTDVDFIRSHLTTLFPFGNIAGRCRTEPQRPPRRPTQPSGRSSPKTSTWSSPSRHSCRARRPTPSARERRREPGRAARDHHPSASAGRVMRLRS